MASATAGPDRRYPSLLGDRLTEFLRAVEEGRLSPGDERVRGLSRLLADRGFLSRSPWLRAVIRYMWDRGLPPCPHPRTARRITSLLRRWSLLATTPAAPAKAHASGSGDAVPAPDSAAGVGTAGRSPDGAEGAGSPSARSIPTGGSADDGWGDQARPSSPVALRVLRPAAFRVAGKARPANLRRVRPLYPQGLAAPAPEG